MSAVEDELRQRLDDAYARADGRARFEALDAVFRHADAVGAEDFAFSARLEAVSTFQHAGEATRALLAFSWCLAAADRRPDLMHGWSERDLLWKYKWIVSDLPEFPDIPLARVHAVVDDMERRYRLGGHSLHAVHGARMWVARGTGDLAGAEESYDRFLSARRDDLSDCSACVPPKIVSHLAGTGRHADAVRVGAENRGRSCLHQPHSMLAGLLHSYLVVGRPDAAVEAHRSSYPRMRSNPHHLAGVAKHAAFCARTGNEAAGLALVERHLPWLDRPTTPMAEMDFAASVALLLGRLCTIGEGGQLIRRQNEDGARRWTVTAAELRDELAARATALAARFDARNGNSYQGDQVAALLAAEPFVGHLPLTVLAGREVGPRQGELARLVERVAELTAAGDDPGAATARLDVAYALRNADRWLDAAEAAEEAVLALDRTGLAAGAVRARYLLWELYRKSWEHQSDALAVLDVLASAADVPADLPPLAALLEDAADMLYGEEAADRLAAAAARHRAAGRTGDELRVLRKLLDERAGDRRAATLARAEELLAVDPGLPVAERARVGVHAARAAADDGLVEDALARADAAAALLVAADLPDEWVDALVVRAEVLLAAGRAAEAEAEARAVHASDDGGAGWRAGVVVVRALRAQERSEEAAAFMAAHEIDEWDVDGSDDTADEDTAA